MKKIKISFLIVLSSFLIHAYLMSTHYSFKYNFESESSLCTINQTLNCEAVSISPYAYFLEIPIATWGSSFHLIYLLLFVGLILYPLKKSSIERFIKLFSVFSLIGTIAMGSISLLLMNTYCLFCILLYILSLSNFVLLLTYKEISFFPNKDDLSQLFKKGEEGLLFITILLIATPLMALTIHDMNTRSFLKQNNYLIQDALASWEKSPSYGFDQPLLQEGSSSPLMKIVEFADFQCIHCKNAVLGLHSFVASKKDVQLQFYSFPLDGSCNPALKQSGNAKSCVFAKAVYCAEKEHKGWEAHRWIFDRFGQDEASQFKKMSETLRLSYDALSSCINSEEAMEAISQQAKKGMEVNVEGTPTIFVNGKHLQMGHLIPVLEEAYMSLKSKGSKN